MPSYPPVPRAPGRTPGRTVAAVVAASVLVVLLVVVRVLVGLGRDQHPAPPEKEPVPEAVDYGPALAQVVSLQDLTDQLTDSAYTLSELIRDDISTKVDTTAETAAYDGRRATFQDALLTLGADPAVGDPEVRAAYGAFEDQSLRMVRYHDDHIVFDHSVVACLRPIDISIRKPDAARAAGLECYSALAPLKESPFPVVVAYADAFETLTRDRQTIYDGFRGGGSAVKELDAVWDAFEPAWNAVTIDGDYDELWLEVSASGPREALQAVLEAKVPVAGSPSPSPSPTPET